ncbi:sensor histidine kinase [Helcococcus kunzii]|uniref:sensor histidine kinase n=1 Tax=Helcococcus kunzii TaxID=40091 RepID=UPI001C96208C|nr:HAMP domain-containing sensor histidine kinase [Helcococcus kunzii]MCT1796563.1 HAMP domain-containing histidine kinase [Helcococcus kunzii]MCT1989514.1 HAMP domain-containing histidine kinase [Helcococcus kunzii]QZO76479.1 HAMP domain-containing histidine kinase [Helcococcus kunzii]
MKNLKIFPKMFIQIFFVLMLVIVLIHSLVFFVFPKVYLEDRKQELSRKASQISSNMNGKEIKHIEEYLELYSKSSEIKAFIKGKNNNNELRLGKELNVDIESENNSLIIEDRIVKIKSGKNILLQFVSTADMQKDAKELTFKFLPFSLMISFLFSIIVSLIYAKFIKNNIQDIKNITDKMMLLDKDVQLKVHSKDEIDELKAQINDLYFTLLKSISDLDSKNKKILKLEKRKHDFFKGASHELKTPLSSLKIILENMKYNIGKYKNRDIYISDCIDIVDELSQRVSQILSVSSIETLKNDEEILNINSVLEVIIKKYQLLASKKNIKINNYILNENMYIGKSSLKIIISNLISNAVKYTDDNGVIDIEVKNGWLCFKNTFNDKRKLDLDRIFQVDFNLNKEDSNGLGLYIVKNILNNYNIGYKVKHEKDKFVFMIEILDIEG